MIGQLSLGMDGEILDKVEMSIERLKAFEPEEGYYVAFSGGKDSQCVYHLCKMAGVKFDAHYSVTSVDPPELVRFIRKQYPDVKFEHQRNKDGVPYTMWNLIVERLMPPTRLARFCCEKLKESSGKYRVTVTGVRREESANRAKNQGIATIPNPGKKVLKYFEDSGVDYTITPKGGLILNYDNSEDAQMITHCVRTTKRLVNPIYDWTEDDVWEFLNSNGIPHCCLYDEGFKRLGCIGCPMGNAKNQIEQFQRWSKYRELYLKAFARMIEERKRRGLTCEGWETPEDVMNWWLGESK